MRGIILVACLVSGCSLYFGSDGSDRPADDPQPDAHVAVDARVPADARITPDAADLGDVPTFTPTCTEECGDQVCSVRGTCVDASSVRDVFVSWPAYTCSPAGVSSIAFSLSSSTTPRIAQIGCQEGALLIKNVPTNVGYLYSLNPAHTYGACDWEPTQHVISASAHISFSVYDVDDDCACF